MKKNMGVADRVIRTVIALVIGVLYFTGQIGGALGIVLLAVAVLLLATGLVGVCPGSLPFKFSTRKEALAAPGGPAPPPA